MTFSVETFSVKEHHHFEPNLAVPFAVLLSHSACGCIDKSGLFSFSKAVPCCIFIGSGRKKRRGVTELCCAPFVFWLSSLSAENYCYPVRVKLGCRALSPMWERTETQGAINRFLVTLNHQVKMLWGKEFFPTSTGISCCVLNWSIPMAVNFK